MESGRVRKAGSAIIRSRTRPQESAQKVMREALDAAGVKMDEVRYCVGTGYGRGKIDFVNEAVSEIKCHAKGANWLLPSARTVIDIGGQDCKAIQLDAKGNVVHFITNDKCASGSGRFLEIMAEALDVPLEEMGEISKGAREDIDISSQCVVFAETKIISLVNEGKEIPDILKALHRAMANRIVSLAKSIGIEREVVITGGGAKNIGEYEALQEKLKMPLQTLKVDPQINGALGAAVMAREAVIIPARLERLE